MDRGPALQGQVIPLFHFAPGPGGFLFLGNSDNVSRGTSLFAPVEGRVRTFRRLETSPRVLLHLSISTVDRRPADPPTRGAFEQTLAYD